jgi:hypothetical protein
VTCRLQVRKRILALILGVTTVHTCDVAHARAWGVDTEIGRRERIILADRPELASCFAAARSYASGDPYFDAFRLELSVARTAYVTESVVGRILVRVVRLEADGRVREHRLFFDTWKPVVIFCEQRDEAPATVRVERRRD